MRIRPITIAHNGNKIHRHNIVPKPIKYAVLGMTAMLTGCVYTPITQDVQEPIKTENVSMPKENTIQEKHLNALKYVFEYDSGQKGVNASYNGKRVIIDIPFVGGIYNRPKYHGKLRFDVENCNGEFMLTFRQFLSNLGESPTTGRYLQELTISKFDSNNHFTITTKRRVHKDESEMTRETRELNKDVYETFEFDQNGNYITNTMRYNERQAICETQLNNIPFLAGNDTKMLASILASMDISSVDAKEQDGTLKLFCDNNDASYCFMLNKGSDNSLYGIVYKMPSARIKQTADHPIASEIYAMKYSEESTESTSRAIVATMRIVQNDVNNPNDNTQKFGERTETHHVVNKEVSSGGLLGGGGILATDEDTFVINYLSEGAISTLYSIEQGGMLKKNGRNMY